MYAVHTSPLGIRHDVPQHVRRVSPLFLLFFSPLSDFNPPTTQRKGAKKERQRNKVESILSVSPPSVDHGGRWQLVGSIVGPACAVVVGCRGQDSRALANALSQRQGAVAADGEASVVVTRRCGLTFVWCHGTFGAMGWERPVWQPR